MLQYVTPETLTAVPTTDAADVTQEPLPDSGHETFARLRAHTTTNGC